MLLSCFILFLKSKVLFQFFLEASGKGRARGISAAGLPKAQDRHLPQGELPVLCANAVQVPDVPLQSGLPGLPVLEEKYRGDVMCSLAFVSHEMDVSKILSKLFA